MADKVWKGYWVLRTTFPKQFLDLDLWKPFKDENPLLKFSVDDNGGQDNKQHQEVVPENEQNENERIMKKWQIL